MKDQNSNPEVPQVLAMSDEEIMEMGDFPEYLDETTEEVDETSQEESGENLEELDTSKEDEDTSEPEEEEITEEESDDDSETEEESEESDGEDEDEADDAESDYETKLKELMAPLTVQGREVTIKSEEEARRLMSMGSDYHLKMADIKPHRKALRMLKNNDLLDEEKLSYLIDLSNKDPRAIQKLMKDSNTDPLSIDLDAEDNYKPNAHTVDDEELELDTLFEEIGRTPEGEKLLNVIGNEWDQKSKQILYKNPNIAATMNEHMQTGVYDTVINEVTRQRMLGNINNLSDVEAYYKVGQMLGEQGAFDKESKPAPKVVKENIRKKVSKADPAKNAKRKAASPPRSRKAPAKPSYDPLGMSDEEFEKTF